MIRLQIHLGDLPADLLADLPEAETVRELAARADTAALVATDAGKLLGYAVFGWDADNMVAVYAARSVAGLLTRAALTGIFGAAEVMGAPVRVHADKLARGLAMARGMGASVCTHAQDMDGVRVAIMQGAAHAQ